MNSLAEIQATGSVAIIDRGLERFNQDAATIADITSQGTSDKTTKEQVDTGTQQPQSDHGRGSVAPTQSPERIEALVNLRRDEEQVAAGAMVQKVTDQMIGSVVDRFV